MRPPDPDPWLLPEDGIIDEFAVDIACRGNRCVMLTMRERELAAIYMVLHSGTRRTIMDNLGLPSVQSAERLMAKAKRYFWLAAWRWEAS